ncbi:hypothetical protein POUND7_019800 [Theobroma cacao]
MHVKRCERIYLSLIPKTEHLFDLRDSMKEEMIKELMVGTTRTKECREWLIKVREFEIRANELIKFHEKTPDSLRLYMKQPHADLMNILDEITHLLESFPLQGATKSMSCSMNGGKSFGPAERTANDYLRRKIGSKGQAYLETGTSHAMGKDAEKREETLPDRYVENETLMASSALKPEESQLIESVESQSFKIKNVEPITTFGSIVGNRSPISGNFEVVSKKASAAVIKSLLPTDQITSSSIDPMTKHDMASSSRNEILPAHEDEIELISFEGEMKPSLSPKIPWTMHGEIEEVLSSYETESEDGSEEARQGSSVEPNIGMGVSTSLQSNIATVEPVRGTSLRKDEILLIDELKTRDPCQTEDTQVIFEPEVVAKTTVERTVLKILELLNDYTVRRIGVYGIGGVGKTTVLKALINYPKTKGMFDLIIWVTVSKFWSIRKMQYEVLRQLSTQNEGEEDVFAWEQAFKQFSGPYRDMTDCNDMIQLLKFSFDRLKLHDIQTCFLHCALFAEDEEVNISEFVKYCIQEGLIAGSMADAYKRGHDIVTILERAFLLESTSNHSIKMHDMMRDLALAILSQEEGSQFLLRAYSKALKLGNHSLPGPQESPQSNRLFIPNDHQFILRAGSGLTEPPSVEEWEKSKMIFLMDNKLSTLPERPSCPGLLTLFLQSNFRLRVLPMSFFDCMPCLKVLNLSKTRIKCLPTTISKLINLETLILCHCERLVTLPSDIGSLKLLQVLDLRGTEISILPDEIGELASLRYLDVCFYGSVNRSEYVKLPHGLISGGIISRLHALNSLGISVCPGDERWDKCVKSIICEVSKLMELTSLSFYFPEVELLELFLQRSKAWIGQCLTEYKIVVGSDIKRIVSRVPHYVEHDYGLMSQCLRFVNGEKIPDAIVKVLACCSAFYLDHHLDISSISKFGIGNINKLKYCIVSECPAIKAILDGDKFTEVVFPYLERLSIHYLWNLEYIWEGVVPEGSFAMLRSLYVHACPKLKYVFKSSMLQFISNLEELIVDDCAAIEKIIFNDKTTDSGQISYSNCKRLSLHYLPALDNIGEGAWALCEHISVYNCPNLRKINLDSKLKHTLKEIKGEKDWWDALDWKEPALRMHFEDRFAPVSEDDI